MTWPIYKEQYIHYMDKSIETPDHYTGRTLMTSHSKYIGPDLQGKIV